MTAGGGAGRLPFAVEIALCIALWYSSSALANTSSRKLLTQAPLPILLTLAQFLTATAFGFVSLRVLKLRPYREVPHSARQPFTRLTAVYTTGFLFVNAGYVVVNVSLAETLRSAEPLVTVLLALLFLKSEPVSRMEMLSMAPIVLGGALSSFGDSSFSVMGLAFVCISNLSFSLRSMFTKKLRQLYDGDAFNVFYQVSALGSVYLIGIVCASELLGAMHATVVGGEAALADMDTAAATAAAPGKPSRFLVSENLDVLLTADTAYLALLNGVTYALYNQTSFYVLSKVRMVTHGVANAFRRVGTILFSVWYFGNHVSGVNAFGIALAISGVLLYAKAKDSSSRGQDAAQQAV